MWFPVAEIGQWRKFGLADLVKGRERLPASRQGDRHNEDRISIWTRDVRAARIRVKPIQRGRALYI